MKRIFTSLLIAAALLLGSNFTYAQWTTVGSTGFTSSSVSHSVVAVNGSNVPYIAYSDNSKSGKLTVRKYNGSSWVTVGGSGISVGTATHIDLKCDGNDVFVSFRDGSRSGKASLMRYRNGSWTYYGSRGFTSGSVEYTSLAISSNGGIYVGYRDNNQSGRATVAAYNAGSNSWIAAGNQVGFSSGQVSYTSLSIDSYGDLYLAYRDHSNSNKLSVKKTSGNGWSTVGNGVSSSSVSYVKAMFDNSNNYYVAYSDGSKSGKVTVRKYKSGSGWSNLAGTGFSAGSASYIDMDLLTNQDLVVSYRDGGNSNEATVKRFNGSGWSNLGTAGFSAGDVEYTSIVVDGNDKVYVGYRDDNKSDKATVKKYQVTVITSSTWDGSSSTNWNTSSNWSNNVVPTSSTSAVIPGGLSRYPNIVNSTGTAQCRNLEIKTGGKVTVNGGTLDIRGSITQNGTFDAQNGYIVLKGAVAQSIPANTFKNNLVNKLELDNSSGCTLGGTLIIKDTYYPASGVLTTNGHLVLRSTATKTARIDRGHGSIAYISGDVTVQRYIPGGRRAFRFLSHPFSSSIKLSQITDDIDITGQGGTTNGFDSVQVNAPSAFWFDVTTADNSTAGNNPGWKAFTSANTNSWDKNEMARILIRGAKGQGLTQGSYTPSAVTLDMKGPVNQGDRWVYLPKGQNSNFVICGNPFPSAVNLKQVYRYNLSHCFCIWNPNQGTKGGYMPYYFSSNYNMPMNGSFVTTVTSGSTGYAYFSEYYKTSSTPAGNQFKTTASQYRIELKVEDADNYWDRLYIGYDDTLGMATQDTFDFVQLNNPEVDFYTMSADNEKLTVDTRPYDKNEIIPVGIAAYQNMNTKIKVSELNIPTGVTLYLHDTYLNKVEQLTMGMEYTLDIDTAIKASYGDKRFYISSSIVPTTVEEIKEPVSGRMQMIPNPATDAVKIVFDRVSGGATVTVRNVAGAVVYNETVNSSVGAVRVPLSHLPNGMYVVELQGNNTRIVEKLIKK